MRKLSLDFWAGVLIAVAPLLLLLNCWNAPFLPYDDGGHIFNNLGPLKWGRLFLVPENSTYFPLTILSYRLDALLFPWMYNLLGTWAPGVRLMTCVYHAGAALFVWRIARLLGLNGGKALFVALAFAVHPTVCETVCWASERKNALAGLFGFASLWAFLRFEGHKRQMPLAVLFYLLALLSKPSALGLLPVLLLTDLCGGVWGLASGDRVIGSSGEQTNFRGRYFTRLPDHLITRCFWRGLPFILLSVGAVIMNLIGHAGTLVPPPGGGVLTALLTDAEVLSRYLCSVFVPVGLSFSYFVAPISSPAEPRFLGYSALLALSFAASAWLAPNRRLALFGWLWFVLSLAPELNLISLPSLMQDRYVYLGLPGILIVAVGSAEGLIQRASLDSRLAVAAGVPFVAALAALGVMRSGLFDNMYALFSDAVRKQPLSADAHKGLAFAYAQICETARKEGRLAEMDEARHRAGRELQCIIDRCPDAKRQLYYLNAAFDAGKYALVLNQPAEAERYFGLVLHPPPWFCAPKSRVTEVLVRLTGIKLGAQGAGVAGRAEEAYSLACQAVAASPTDGDALLARASAALALAATVPEGPRRQELRRQAEKDAAWVPRSSPRYDQAQELLSSLRQ